MPSRSCLVDKLRSRTRPFSRDVHGQGVEFAAEGGTADPCFLLRVGKRKGKSDPVADVPGGPGGSCRWAAQTCLVTSVSDTDVRCSGLKVQAEPQMRPGVVRVGVGALWGRKLWAIEKKR